MDVVAARAASPESHAAEARTVRIVLGRAGWLQVLASASTKASPPRSIGRSSTTPAMPLLGSFEVAAPRTEGNERGDEEPFHVLPSPAERVMALLAHSCARARQRGSTNHQDSAVRLGARCECG